MKLLLIVFVLALVGGWLFVRWAPADVQFWHVSPTETPRTWHAGYRVTPPDAPVFSAPSEEVVAAILTVAEAEPRVVVLHSDPDTGLFTFQQRTRILGFPDVVNVALIDANGGTTIAILSRSRFAGYDWGANRARVERWLAEIEARLDA